MLRTLTVAALLTKSNVAMTFAWYGHLQLKRLGWLPGASLLSILLSILLPIVLLSWSLALPEYTYQVPANRLGYRGTGGAFSLFELKVLQEVIPLTVFSLVAVIVFRTERVAWNHLVGFTFLLLAVFFVFRKW